MREHPGILSNEFESDLYDPQNMADFISASRVTSNTQSLKAVKTKEHSTGMGISDLNAITSKTRPQRL